MFDSKMLDNVLAEIIRHWGIPGMAVGIVQDDELIYIRGFGVQSLESQTPVNMDTIFCVASIAKCFVASAIMQLVESRKLQLEMPLVHFLPEFRLADYRFREITIQQMLSHTSGMPDMDEQEYDTLVAHPEIDDGAAKRYVQALEQQKLIAPPGERFFYSNIAYNVLGYLISRVSGQSFEDYMKDHILNPVGMNDSTFYFPEVPRHRLAVPHLRTPSMRVNPVYPYHRADAPASFLHSTVVDMCRWMMTCLRKGSDQAKRLLSDHSYQRMWTPVARRGNPPFYEEIGLGWTLGHFDGLRTVSHGGMGFGWTDFLLLLPDKNQGAIIMCNEESWARSRTVRAVLNAMLGREPQAGLVSWMVPVSQALQDGGIQAAHDWYDHYLRQGDNIYAVDEDDLVSLVYQLVSVNKVHLAMEVLQLNLRAFPEHGESKDMLERLQMMK